MVDGSTIPPAAAEAHAPEKAGEKARRPASIWLVANPASGSTDPAQVAALRAALVEAGATIAAETVFPDQVLPDPARLVAAGVDTLVIIGGDGTINAAIDAAADWPGQCLVLPGGTMNLLPRALHGTASVPDILSALAGARLVRLPIAEAEGHHALVGVILGPTAAWARAREGLRHRRFGRAIRAAQIAWARSFAGGVAVIGRPGRHRAVVVTPDAAGLEVVIIDASGIGDVLRIGWSWLTGDWRATQLVDTERAVQVTLAGRRRVRALFDGEPATLPSPVTLRHGWTRARFVATAPAP